MNVNVKAEFEAAIATARHALEEFNREPLVRTKRGHDTLSPWWRVYIQASEVAQRWHRQLGEELAPSFEDELDRILGGAEE
jgi:hypothetical protein